MVDDAVIKRGEAVDYTEVEAANGLSKGVLIGEAEGAPNFAIRRFVLDPGAAVPRHTNRVEHLQFVLEGHYGVDIGEDTYMVAPGDSLYIPAGVEHAYQNHRDDPGAFLCVVPHGDDEIELVD